MATHRHTQTDTDTHKGKAGPNEEIVYKIVGLAIEIRKELGLGFMEKVYENAMMVLLKREGIAANQQYPVDVSFHGEKVGHYLADILVDGQIILEIKCAEAIVNAHRAQALNYLKATGLRLALILNFSSTELHYERIIL